MFNRLFGWGQKPPKPHFRDFFDGVLEGFTLGRDTISIVQVGANDGTTSDPIAPFFESHSDKAQLLAIEPDPDAFSKLQSHYRKSGNVVCVNAAIGNPGRITFYRIAPAHWDEYRRLQRPSVSDSKKNPTAVTSTDKEDVIQRVASNTGLKPCDVEGMLIPFECESLPLSSLLDRIGWSRKVDVLQLGMNGFDGELLLDSIRDFIFPSIVYFKTKDVDARNQARLDDCLEGRGYSQIEWRKGCKCAFRVNPARALALPA
jgi:FkbM family methyltransferase